VCVSDNTYKDYAYLRVPVPVCVSGQSNMCVDKSRDVLCVHMAVPMCHEGAVCLCERERKQERWRYESM